MRFLKTKLAASALVAALLVRLAAACIDVDLVFVPPRDAAAVDGAPCLACLLGDPAQGGCGDKIATCEADPRCDLVYVCMKRDACFDRPLLDDKINCTLPCLTDSGIVSTDDPVVGTLIGVVQCGQKTCLVECHLPEAGLDIDAF